MQYDWEEEAAKRLHKNWPGKYAGSLDDDEEVFIIGMILAHDEGEGAVVMSSTFERMKGGLWSSDVMGDAAEDAERIYRETIKARHAEQGVKI